jgi:mRNA-degrading endonuclease RelE of RelBE toxin-antitoxin system
MNFNIFPTRRFERELKRFTKKFPSIKSEFATLIETLIDNPKTGEPIGKDCYKIRLAIASKSKGKSGGARVITYTYFQNRTIYLLTIFDKSEKDNISDKELGQLIKELKL